MTISTSSPKDMGKQRASFGWGGSRWQWLVAMDRGHLNNAMEYWVMVGMGGGDQNLVEFLCLLVFLL